MAKTYKNKRKNQSALREAAGEKINFGNVQYVFLFGGGITLRHLSLKLRAGRFRVVVFSSKRLLKEDFAGASLENFLKENGIDFEETADINSNKRIRQLIKASPGFIGISFGAPWIFKPEFNSLFKGGLLNYHPRNLPRDRGAGGYSWMILNGERRSACLLHQVDAGIDTGKIVKFKEFSFPPSCRIPIDFEKYAFEKNRKFLEAFILELAKRKTFSLISQRESHSTYFPRLHSATQGFINWDWKTDKIIRFCDAFNDPYCGASTFCQGRRVYLKEYQSGDDQEFFHDFLSGLVYRKDQRGIFIATKDGSLAVSRLTDENGVSIMEKIKVGHRFLTPGGFLDKAKEFYPVYTPDGLKEK